MGSCREPNMRKREVATHLFKPKKSIETMTSNVTWIYSVHKTHTVLCKRIRLAKKCCTVKMISKIMT